MTDSEMRLAAEGWDANEVAAVLSASPTANGLSVGGIVRSRGKLFEYAVNRARPLKRAIQREALNPLAQSILRGDVRDGSTVTVDAFEFASA